MAIIAERTKVDENALVETLKESGENMKAAGGEVAFDFSAVHRVDARAVRALEKLAGIADDKCIKVTLHGVHVSVYKVLKLVKLGSRFSFVS